MVLGLRSIARARAKAVFVLSCALFALSLARVARAESPPLAGQWSATALTSNWNIGDWGNACGPKPGGGGEPSGTATIQEGNGELVIAGAGRTFTTRECWEQFPGLSRTSHSASARAWRTTCRSGASDPRQATIVTNVTVSGDDLITLDETGQYQFVIQGQNCTASVRRTRFFRRLRAPATNDAGAPLGAASAAESGERPQSAAKKEDKGPACETTGPPARIEVRPSHKLIRPGESFTFRASVVDARGCTLGITPSFRSQNGPASVSVATNGRVDVGEGTPEGDVQLVAAVGSRSVNVVLQVVSRERYEGLLAEGGFDSSGANEQAAVARLESGSVGARSTVVEDDSARRRALFVGLIGGTALLLGIVGFVLVRRSRNRAHPVPSSGARVARAEVARPQRQMVCPTCREEFPPEATFCPADGNRLVALEGGVGVGPAGAVCPVCGQGYDPGISICPKHDEPLVPPAVYASARAARQEIQKICPVCGTQFGGASQFCGKCGAALVQVN